MKEHKISTKPELGKKDSFYGDRSIVLSKKQLESIKSNPLINGLYISDIGFYPNAKNHFRRRKKGINEHILIYCIDGSGSIQVSDTIFELKPNSFFIIRAHEIHKYWSSDDFPWSIYWLHFGGKKSRYFEIFFDKVIQIEQSNRSRIDDRLSLFNEILTALESGFSAENINYANMCLNSLLASFFYIETYRLVKGYHNPNKVDQAIIYMQKNLNKFLTIKEIASHVELSESHFSKIFRNKTGSSPLDYFINLKLQEAIRLLTNQSLKIKEVAFKLGYSDPYYFTRIFSKHIGSSPGTFVKTINPQS
ncbi:AraC family transcriptional regulator [Maribellus sediminis]|uniref:AraC family transcriptional regulator n=1 Tax=Maribellus sediminis TaxID=2696285 RepID=UPI001430F2D5|nr:AraC family transcriptional regulator [Maribellus sediminis]